MRFGGFFMANRIEKNCLCNFFLVSEIFSLIGNNKRQVIATIMHEVHIIGVQGVDLGLKGVIMKENV